MFPVSPPSVASVAPTAADAQSLFIQRSRHSVVSVLISCWQQLEIDE